MQDSLRGISRSASETFRADVDVDYVKLGIEPAGHAGRAGDQVLRGGIRAYADGQALADRPSLADVFCGHVIFEAAIDVLGDLAQG